MAIYEFGCGSCKAVLERRQAYDDPPPSCCDVPTVRLISMPARAVLTGAGCYETEYGGMAHHLKPRDQAIRSERDLRQAGLVQATPRAGEVSEKQMEKYQRQREAG